MLSEQLNSSTSSGLGKILNLLEGVVSSGTGYSALCPGHNDSSPSLSIREDGGQILLKCHAGCKTLDVISSLGLEWQDLFVSEDFELWHKVYKRMLELLTLNTEDEHHLKGRGLSTDYICLAGYRSLGGSSPKIQKLHNEFGEQLFSVPGFVRRGVSAATQFQHGILLPVSNHEKQLRGFQVHTGGRPKYLWFSGETKAKASCHVPWQGVGRNCVRITEGVLKADIATALDSHTLTIGVPGVNSWHLALPALRGLQCYSVLIAFDADWTTNGNVRKALTDLYYGLKNEGIQPLVETWEGAKGIDDALLAGSQISTHKSIPGVSLVEGVRPASSYDPVDVDWLWHGWIPRGMITVIEGDPSLGKSTLCAHIAMCVTTGHPFPSCEQTTDPGCVLYLSSEDDPGRITVPRMRAAGADLDKVFFWDTFPTLPEKLAELEEVITKFHVSLVVLDPFLAFISEELDSYKDQSIRQVLSPLSKLAERTNCSVLLIRHLNKQSNNPNQLYRGGGSIAIIAAARVCLYLVNDDDGDRVLGQAKNNLAPKQMGHRFKFVETENWQDTRLQWNGRHHEM